MKKTTFLFAIMFMAISVMAQKKTTTSGTIIFDATTEKDALPKAENKTVIAAIDTKKGTVAFEVMMKNFTFSNPTIQDHFNGSKWLDSEKFPTATFKGSITNLAAVNFNKNGTYPAEVAGDLTIRGVTKPVKATGTITVADKVVTAKSDFTINLTEFGITGGAITAGKVANDTKISVLVEVK